jgi:hypothetical protein
VTIAQPDGDFQTGVLGKWHYVDDLDAFIALDEYDHSTADAAVWLYKPFSVTDAPTGPVPEPASWLMLLLGFAAVQRISNRNSKDC